MLARRAEAAVRNRRRRNDRRNVNWRPVAAVTPPSAASIAASAASAFDPSGPPACAMSGLPPPPLPPSTSAPFLHQIDGVEARDQIVGDADHDAGLAVAGDADNGDNAGADLFLAFVGEAAQVLEIDAFHRARHQLHVADGAHAIGAVALAASAPPPPTCRPTWRASSSRRTVRVRDACALRAAP